MTNGTSLPFTFSEILNLVFLFNKQMSQRLPFTAQHSVLNSVLFGFLYKDDSDALVTESLELDVVLI